MAERFSAAVFVHPWQFQLAEGKLGTQHRRGVVPTALWKREPWLSVALRSGPSV